MSLQTFETISRFNVGRWRIRVWRYSEKLSAAPQKDLQARIDEFLKNLVAHGEEPTAETLISELVTIDRVSAVEVTDAIGHGGLAYVDWP